MKSSFLWYFSINSRFSLWVGSDISKKSTLRRAFYGAGNGSRTRLISLGSWNSTDELCPPKIVCFIISPVKQSFNIFPKKTVKKLQLWNACMQYAYGYAKKVSPLVKTDKKWYNTSNWIVTRRYGLKSCKLSRWKGNPVRIRNNRHYCIWRDKKHKKALRSVCPCKMFLWTIRCIISQDTCRIF